MAHNESRNELSETELAILAFERGWREYAPTRDQAIRARFGISPFEYYVRLNSLISSPAAFRADPQLVGHLHRIRQRRLDERHRDE